MPEYEQPRRVDAAAQARRDLAAGLGVLAHMPGLIAGFTWAAGQLPLNDPQILGMIEFAMEFQRHGLETALEAVERGSGVPVEIEKPMPARGEHVEQGHIVGIVEKHVRTSFPGVFYGIAVMPNFRGASDFHAVSIATDGRDIRTKLLPEHLEPEYQEMPGKLATEAILKRRLAQNHMTDGGSRQRPVK